jgi:restriction system protein
MWGLKNVLLRRYDALSRVSWREFECLMAQHYRDRGYRVAHVGSGERKKKRFDGGIDLKLYRDGEYAVVQCKHWNVKQVPHNAVHELIGVMHTEKAQRAIFITSGEYTRAALAAAAKIPQLQIIDGNAVRAMLDPANGPTSPPSSGDARFFDEARSWTFDGTAMKRNRPALWPRLAFALIAIPIMLAIAYQTLVTLNRVASHPAGTQLSTSAPLAAPVQVSDRRSSTGTRTKLPQVSAPQAATYQSDPMTDSELKDWKRRNTEAMKIIEKTTPEI